MGCQECAVEIEARLNAEAGVNPSNSAAFRKIVA